MAKIVATLANGLDSERYESHAWFLTEDGPLLETLIKSGAHVRFVKWRHGWRDPGGAWRFWRALAQDKFDIVHQHFGGRSVRWLIHRGGAARILVHVHGRGSEMKPNNTLHINIMDADAVIANSQAVARQVVNSQAYVVHPCVSILSESKSTASRSPHKQPIIGTACRLVPIKGIVYLIRAISLLQKTNREIVLEIAGSGPEQTTLEAEIEKHGLSKQVKFLGWRTDLSPLFAQWRLFILPSLEEGFGMAALEAMATGLPVIGTTVGGIPELIVDNETGFLVPPRDAEALADRIEKVLSNPPLERAMGDMARLRAHEQFSCKKMVRITATIYDTFCTPTSLPCS
jgi:glycosyltransferase involved in cell wall biosynthesis